MSFHYLAWKGAQGELLVTVLARGLDGRILVGIFFNNHNIMIVYILFVSLLLQQALEYMGQWYKLCSARQLPHASSQRAMA